MSDPRPRAAALDCGCDDFSASRRRFLAGATAAAGAGVLSSVMGDAFRQVAFGAITVNSNVVVVLSLRGGADGLSMVVPHGDPAYASARPRIAIPTSALLGSDAMFGLHPAFAPLESMWRDGTFGAVHAVGLPQPNRSHFAAMEVLEDSDAGSPERRGWINRLVGVTASTNPGQAVQMGNSMLPTALYGPAPVLGLRGLKDVALSGNSEELPQHRRSLDKVWGSVPGPLGRGARAALTTTDQLGRLGTITPRPQNGARYPTGDLGGSLLETAELIRAGVGTRVVTIDYGSWDMHTSLGTLAYGRMRSNVDELSRALQAFFVDLGSLAQRVTVVTVSEFGRRVAENGDVGLDHGYGNCMLLLGAGVRGGQVHANWPGLGREKLVDGDLQVTRDHRSVFIEVLRSRFPEVNLSTVFPSFTPEPIGSMR